MQQEVGVPAQLVGAQNWVSCLEAGEAGVRQGAAIKFRAGLLGCVARGSLGRLKPGGYRFALGIRGRRNRSAGYDARVLIELTASSRLICAHVLTRADLRNPDHEFIFDVPEHGAAVDLHISAIASVEASIDEVFVEPVGGPPERPLSQPVRLHNWLPLLEVGPAGNRPEFGAQAELGVTDALEGCSGLVICGPRWPLAAGPYLITAVIELSEAGGQSDAMGRLDVVADTIAIASAGIQPEQAGRHFLEVPFEVAGPAPGAFPPLVEIRVSSKGAGAFRVRSVTAEPRRPGWKPRKRPLIGKLLARTKASLSRPFERAVARSVAPLVAKLEARIMQKIEQIETVQHAQYEREDDWLERTLGRIEGQAFRQEEAIQIAAKQQRAAAERLGRRLEQLEGQVSRQEQVIQVLTEHQRAVGETLGRRLEGLEGQTSGREEAI